MQYRYDSQLLTITGREGSIILSIGRGCKLKSNRCDSLTTRHREKTNIQLCFFLLLCIINYLSVVTKLCLCWERSESPFEIQGCVHQLIPRFSSCLLLFLECAIRR